ncbi:MAG: CDP-alcohol phosphatidyltransferase family protein [Cyanobacteriota bacterium]|jgi:CDP-diacylglycerol--glycerol-3-phosphate 3-phosphatidyltransferase|nr:CDP-alcohol phosphatidyltransferase family protein [Cyanobacteriota bacterium]
MRWARPLADGLTVMRGVLGLPLLLALQAGWSPLAWGLLLLGGLSDALDGWLARRAGGGSVWGARLDPLTDKLLVCAPLLWLASRGQLPLVAVWLLLARELFVSGWRAQQGSGGPASRGGKLKTILQFLALLLLLWPSTWPGASAAWRAGWWLFWPGLLLALSSAVGYLRPAGSRPPLPRA